MEPIDPPQGQTRKDLWAYWGGKGKPNGEIWYTDDDLSGVQNRMTTYDNRQPIPVGFDEKTWARSDRTSWVFKRNFTFDVINDGASGNSWWDATARDATDGKTLKHPATNNFQSIVCAVNIFGQTDYFMYPVSGGKRWNAYCYSGKKRRLHEWDDQYGLSRCWVEFGIQHNVKRSLAGDDKPQWVAESVTLFDEDREFIDFEPGEFGRRALAEIQTEPQAEALAQVKLASAAVPNSDTKSSSPEGEAVTTSPEAPYAAAEAVAAGVFGISP
ncbi:hypothetical protein MFIFM68171_07914 [Madurella fahalii]|uniref:Uncharacterized protein n=1 Tax=Madurella fahalii TaxID=1157608 RepID=A0ABQ0GIV4_9PEZI